MCFFFPAVDEFQLLFCAGKEILCIFAAETNENLMNGTHEDSCTI